MYIIKKYFNFFYFLVIKNNFYNYFFLLIFNKIINIFTLYNLKQKELIQKKKSLDICRKKFKKSEIYIKKNLNFSNFYNKKNCIFLQKEIAKVQNKYKKNFKEKGPANLNLLICYCFKVNPKYILETGVSQGWSSLVFLNYLNILNQNGKLFSIDLPYIEKKESYKEVGNVIEKKFYKYWKLYKMPDSYALKKIKKLNIKFDLVHYDSDKSISGRMRSYPILWSLLNKNGILISDDIGDNMAFFNFCKSLKKKPDIIKYKNKFQGLIKKK